MNSWRRYWASYAALYAISLVALLIAGEWLASFFCASIIYYCLLARWRESRKGTA